MPERIHAPQVGAPDPELRTSPVIDETDENIEAPREEIPESTVCYFNNIAYRHGDFVCSGSELLRCDEGAWVSEGSCDPDNP